MCRTFLVVLVWHKMCLYTSLWGATILRRAFACFWVGTSISEIISVLLALDTFIYGYSEDCHAKDQYCIICKIEKSSNSFSACLLSNKDVRCYIYNLLSCSIIMKLWICLASFTCRTILRLIKPRDIKIETSIIDYLIPRHFLWIKKCKLLILNSFPVFPLHVPKQIGFLLTRINCSRWRY